MARKRLYFGTLKGQKTKQNQGRFQMTHNLVALKIRRMCGLLERRAKLRNVVASGCRCAQALASHWNRYFLRTDHWRDLQTPVIGETTIDTLERKISEISA